MFFALYVAAIALANWMTATFGLIWLAGFAITAGTFAAGLTFVARDMVQKNEGIHKVLWGVVVGGFLSLFFNPQLAVASSISFMTSELLDTAIYTPLRKRGMYRAVFVSGLVGGAYDTALFIALAGFPVEAFYGVFAVKLLVQILALPILRRFKHLA